MRIKQLLLKDFGPFRRYKVSFLEEDGVCLLLTGKNNEGKSSLINGLKLLNGATKVINKTRQEINVDGSIYYELLKQDTENLLIRRMIHNYSSNIAEVTGIFQDGLVITVRLDPIKDIIYAEFNGRIPSDIQKIFGFIPPLGPLSEVEEYLGDKYIKSSIDTSLAPRHLRNHFLQILSAEEYSLVKQLVKKTWQDVELLDCKIDFPQNKIYCYFKEDRVDREISWAGQGLQIWFQIITHTVRLRDTSVLILDEPEINLHPEKQNDLIRILKDYYHGSIIIATHSVELMNNVSVSHIINVQKKHSEPKIKSTEDRIYLNLVRSQIGSNFNLIASQFDLCDIIIFTEDTFDFGIIHQLATYYNIQKKAFNIPIHGFSEYRKCIPYKDAYTRMIGKDISYTTILDRDYYPEEYLRRVKDSLQSAGIRTIFTPGKEIENIFLSPNLLSGLIPQTAVQEFSSIWNQTFDSLRIECYGSYLTLHKQFLDPGIDMKTITTRYTPAFEKCWKDPYKRHQIVDGNEVLKVLRGFYRKIHGSNLNQSILIDMLVQYDHDFIKSFVEKIFHIGEANDQVLHY